MDQQSFFSSSDTIAALPFLAEDCALLIPHCANTLSFTDQSLNVDELLSPESSSSSDVDSPAEDILSPDASQPEGRWSNYFAEVLQQQHRRVRIFLEQQRDRWLSAEGNLLAQIEQLKDEARSLQAECEQSHNTNSQHSGEALNDANRRYQLALGDLRQLEVRNAELQQQLARLTAYPGQVDCSTGSMLSRAVGSSGQGGYDWESEKRRILASLELDESAPAAPDPAERPRIEEILLRTDHIIAEKNREIQELSHLLESQSSSVGSLAVGAAAMGELLDVDALIVEERARLSQLQIECHEKLRQAEVEISMERARLARREMEVEEKLNGVDERSPATEPSDFALAPTGRPVRGRWRAQLGLMDDVLPSKEHGQP